MPTYIPDQNFPHPSEINIHPCLTASRFLNAVPESVTIGEVCQDSYNTSLVVFNISLVGAFLFTPTLKIVAIDGSPIDPIVAPFALGHFKNPTLPINTHCTTWHGQLVFDVGVVVSNYISAHSIEFLLEMQGTVPQAYGVSFPNQIFSTSYIWNKGILPTPVKLTYNGGNLGIEFLYEGNRECNCNIQCTIPSGVSRNVSFCPGETQTIVVSQDPNSTDPYSLLIQLSDSLGNISNLEVEALFNTIPRTPDIVIGTKPKRINLSVNRLSENDVQISDKAAYQIVKYIGNPANYQVWKDWSYIPWNNFIDYDVIEGKEYGYAVRYKGSFGDVSKLSSWATVTL